MNYYKHHLGDYASATRHLSLLEHGVYRCLIDLYYVTEKPIPLDIAAACRLVCARSKDERAVVQTVLEEFFTRTDEGWTHARCEAEISDYTEKAERNREVGKKGGRPRKTETQTVSEKNPNGFQQETQTVSEKNPSHKPIANSHNKTFSLASDIPTSTGVTPAGLVCARLKSECRIPSVNPQHPKLLALLAAGITEDELVSAGMDANGKGFAWVLAAAEGRRRDADSVSGLPLARASQINGRRNGSANGRQAAIDNYAAEAAQARGDNRGRSIAGERDITGESVRVA